MHKSMQNIKTIIKYLLRAFAVCVSLFSLYLLSYGFSGIVGIIVCLIIAYGAWDIGNNISPY